MKISLFVSLCCSVVFYSSAGQAACVQPPSCDELGFTSDASKCDGSFLKCPWNLSKAACTEVIKTSLPILYGDGTVASKIIDSKTPIGVVFDEENKLAMALGDIKEDGTVWSFDINDINNENARVGWTWPSDVTVTTNNYSCSNHYDTCEADGRISTNIILACGKCETSAAIACNKFEPDGCTSIFCKKSKWYLPSIAELIKIRNNKYFLEKTINVIRDHLLPRDKYGTAEWDRLYKKYDYISSVREDCYWSSIEQSNIKAYVFQMDKGTVAIAFKSSGRLVRPIVKY